MSVYDENLHSATPSRQLDLLVDDELSEADRRALLLQLEHEPDGWRRCALAFLESQCWRALGRIVDPAAAAPVAGALTEGTLADGAAPAIDRPAPASRAEPRKRQAWRQRLATGLSIAASFLIALVVGMNVRDFWPNAAMRTTDPSLKTTVDVLPLRSQPADNWETVTLKSSDDQPFQVRAVRRDTLDRAMLERVPDVIPPELRRAFEQSGQRIEQQREIVPVPMPNGSHLVVPVDHIEIHYVGQPAL